MHTYSLSVFFQLEQQLEGQPQLFTQKQRLVLIHQWLLGGCSQSPSKGALFHQVINNPLFSVSYSAVTTFGDAVGVRQPIADAGSPA